MGAICCHGNQSFDPIWSKTSCSLSPIPMMLLIKFHCDRPTGCRDIHVWNCGRQRTTEDDRRTPDHGYTKSSPSSLRLRWAKNIKNKVMKKMLFPSGDLNPYPSCKKTCPLNLNTMALKNFFPHYSKNNIHFFFYFSPDNLLIVLYKLITSL